MVVIKGKFAAKSQQKQEAPQMDNADKMMADLGLDNLVVISQDDRGAVVACFSEYQGRSNFQVKTVYKKDGRWCHGKGLTINPKSAKEVCTNLGELGAKL